jgi:DNA polymerase-3 subunit alpha
MDAPGFVHLRVHTEYSISDSIVRIDALVEAALADQQPAVAVTDLGNLFAWVKFYKAARAKGIQPICGADVWVSNDLDRERPFRLLLLVENQQGYLSLCRLLSRAWLENEHRGRGEIRKSWFAEHDAQGHRYSQGLIALSGGVEGEIGQALVAGRRQQAAEIARCWAASFDVDCFFLEVWRRDDDADEAYVRDCAQLATLVDLPIVATHPVQFIDPKAFRAHEARVCIAEGEMLANPRRPRHFTETQYFLSQAQMQARFADLPVALAHTLTIAQRCCLTMTLGKAYLPDFPTPAGLTIDSFMREQAAQGLEQRLKQCFPDAIERESHRSAYQDRLHYECDTIVQMGFSGYFLIVADFINWAKAHQVPVGPGRGSGAGSLVAFALGITDLDPIPYALLFERFLNPERVSMPDFDIDFCQDKRSLVIDYVRKRYGSDAVSQIATFGTMASKAVIRDVGRVLDIGYNFCDQLSKLIPVVQNKPLSLAKAREAEPLLKQREQEEDEVREILALAEPLEDITRNVGMHAGGVLIAPGQLTDFCPLYRQPGDESSVISQFDKDDVEAVGLVKFDFLGLRNLTIIETAVEFIRRRQPDFQLEQATKGFDDPAAYQVLKQANTTAIFQLESEGMKKLLRKLEPDRFEDIIAVLALYRPGPLGSGMVDDFILRKKGVQRIDYFHPDLQACLEPTYGVIVYQEQVMQIAQIIGAYTLGSADLLRRAMGKKKPEEMAQHRDVFVKGASSKGYSLELANKLFDLMAMFAEYGFNKSHTAAYAVITYQTAWLKAHYPAEFMAATLSSDMDDTDKVQLFVSDTKNNGVLLLPPDVHASAWRFEPVYEGEKAAIRYGLGAVKGAGEAAVKHLLAARAQGRFKHLFDLCKRVDRRIVNRRTLEAMIRAGALDEIELDRARALASVGLAMDEAEKSLASLGQESLFGEAFGQETDAGTELYDLKVPVWSERQRLQEEKLALGFYLSGHLFHAYADEVRRFVRLSLAQINPAPQAQWVAGVVTAVRTQMTRRGKMLFVTLDDATATLEAAVFAESIDKHRQILKIDDLLIACGKVSRDDYSGGQRLVVDRMLDLSSARAEFARSLRLELNGQADAIRLKKALTLFSAPEGQQGCEVIVRYYNSNASCELKLPSHCKVRPDDALLALLHSEFKGSQAEVVYN